MLTPQTQAMVQGMQQGSQQAQSILPSTFQPQGRSGPSNPWEGVLNMIQSQILEVAAGVGQQGLAYNDQKERLYKFAYELQKLNNQLTDMAIDGGMKSPARSQLPY